MTDKTITNILNHYLKNIREELIEEENNPMPSRNNEIVYINAQINGTQSTIMIDTGSNISLIDNIELTRIQQGSQTQIPTLPINNVTIIGAMGKQNKTIRKQVSLELTSHGVTIPMAFLVCKRTAIPYTYWLRCSETTIRHNQFTMRKCIPDNGRRNVDSRCNGQQQNTFNTNQPVSYTHLQSARLAPSRNFSYMHLQARTPHALHRVSSGTFDKHW